MSVYNGATITGSLKRTSMYFNHINIKEFLNKLYGHLLPPNVTLDLSEAEKIYDWEKIFYERECSFNLTMNFGEKCVADSTIEALISGLLHANNTYALSFCFWGVHSLNAAGLNELIYTIQNGNFLPGFSLYISAKNIENHHAFNQIIDAFFSDTSKHNQTLNLYGPLSQASHAYLERSLSEKQLPLGNVIRLSHPRNTAEYQLIKDKTTQSLVAYSTFLNQVLENIHTSADATSLKNQLIQKTLVQLLEHTGKHLKFLKREAVYFSDVNLFKQCVRLNYVPASNHMTLDLAPTFNATDIDFRNYILRQLTQLLASNAPHCTIMIDFGKKQLSDPYVKQLMMACINPQFSEKLKLCFRGQDSLGPATLGFLNEQLTSGKMTGLHLQISGENIEKYHAFQYLCRTITSSACIPWLTLDFDNSTLSHESIECLEHALLDSQAIGLWVKIGENGTRTQRQTIHSCNRASFTASLPQLDPSNHSLRSRLEQQLAFVSHERIKKAQQVERHIETLQNESPSFSGKKARIPSLVILTQMLLNPELIDSAYVICCNWEMSRLTSISTSRLLKHSTSLNSTQQFILDLKSECITPQKRTTNAPIEKSKSFMSIESSRLI
jgi:hypothetical protein